jgi:predicted enzyme related to lactoylglutathione lyase
MQERKEYPAGVPCWVDTGRQDPQTALDFYGGLFGWEFENVSPSGAPRYFTAKLHGLTVAAVGEQPGMDWAPMWNSYVRVESADEMAAKAAAEGGNVTMEPFDAGTAGRLAAFTDPEGASLCVWEPNETRGLQLVNDPGAWVSSELSTRDPAGAAAFYGALFGWETRPLGDEMTMFVRPGYAEFLAQDDPEMPGRLEEYQAPEGFGDMVAYLVPSSDEQGPPAWGITFSVEDADASAERARELGGKVLVEPFDAPWVRMTVVSDPEGAVVSLSQFVPPS